MDVPPDHPDEPASPDEVALRSSANEPLPRHEGERAELTQLAARLVDAADAEDAETERALSVELARLYASRGTDLDEAVRLLRRAIALGDDAALRTELSGWLSGIGEPSLAADEVAEVAATSETPRASSKSWMRAAVLYARAGNATKARAALGKASEVDPRDAIPHELNGTLAAWSPDAQGAVSAAEAYLRAAKLRDAAGDSEAAFEDTLRAFETARGSVAATQALVEALRTRGRGQAADEVLCLHADTLSTVARVELHKRRFADALAAGDLPRALLSVFDAGIDVEGDASAGDDVRAKVDELLSRVGMYDLLAARLGHRAGAQSSAAAAETYASLARLAGGPLARPDRAIDAHLAAASLDPESTESRRALRDHAEVTGDLEPLVEALVRVATSPGSVERQASRARALRELAELAQERLADPVLALWAYDELAKTSEGDRETAQLARARLEGEVRQADEEIARLEASLARKADGADDARDARVAALVKLSKLYRSRPDRRSRWIEVLASLVRAEPLQVEPARALERVMARGAAPASREERELYESVLRSRLDAALPARERSRVRRELARLFTATSAEGRPIEDVAPLLAGDPAAAADLYVLATLERSDPDRAHALLDLAEPLGPPLQAVVMAVASEILLASGDSSTALRAAESAISAAPASARAARALARAAAARGDRESASALERAMGVLAPTVELCAELAEALDVADEPSLSFAWTQRWLALTPSSPRAIRELVKRAINLGDAARLAEALAWVLAQPEPFAELAAPLLEGLEALFAIDVAKARSVARKALDVFGPKDSVLRRALVRLGDDHGDKGLAIAAIERWVATQPEPTVATFIDLALRRSDAADFDGAARELSRAAAAGGGAEATLDAARDLEALVQSSSKKLSPDGRVWLAEAIARSLSDIDGEGRHSEATLGAWRILGALRWDLAEDYRGSEQALFAASDPVDRFDLYVQDLVELAGPEQAVLAIRERALVLDGEPKRKARLLTAAARAAAEHGLLESALETAAAALELDASQPEAVAVAEASARGQHGAEVLSRIYDGLASAAMGVYGQRAAHYRAARQLERRGASELALKHAIASFEAVPTEGTSWQLVTRLVESTGDASEAIRVLERIGQAARPEERSSWLKRAALLTRPTQEGLGIRLDILLRALLGQPDSSLVASIEETVLALNEGGESPELSSARFERALYATLPKLEGPDGAFVGIRLARAALHVGLSAAAFASLAKAVVCDAGHGSFADLVTVVDALAREPAGAQSFVASVEASRTSGKEALDLAARVAEALGELDTTARIRAELSRRDAEERAQRAETFDLGSELDLGSEPPPAMPAGASTGSSTPRSDQDAAPASEAADTDRSGEASTSEPLGSDEHAASPRASAPSVEVVEAAADDLDASVEHAASDATSSDATSPDGTPSEVPWSDARSSKGPPSAAGRSDAAPPEPADDGSRRASQPPIPSEPPPSLAGPGAALEARQRDAHERGDHEEVAQILQQRIGIAPTDEVRRVLRLRRAALLEQRLGRVEEACAELEAILTTSPDDKSALSYLADLYGRTEHADKAAPLWERLSEQPERSEEERVEFALKAVYGFTVAGEPERALSRLEKVKKHVPTEVVAELRVSAARASGDQLGLALALDELSSVKRFESAEDQASVLHEAAQAALASGDESGALLRLRRAARLDPKNGRAALEALRLEYRHRGTGTPREAQAAVDQLAAITEGLADDLVELHTFLLAEELDVIQGGGAGMRELTHRHAEIGPLPLIALGMAERLARNRTHEQALPLYQKALEGDFQGLRSRGRVALAAADSAIQVGSLELAQKLLDEAQDLPETRSLVERRRRELLAAHPDPEVARAALVDLVQSSTGLARARFLERLAALTVAADRAAALARYEEALSVGRHDRALTERVRRAIALLRAEQEAEEPEREATPPAPAADEAPPSEASTIDAPSEREPDAAVAEEATAAPAPADVEANAAEPSDGDRTSEGFAEVQPGEVTLSSVPPPREPDAASPAPRTAEEEDPKATAARAIQEASVEALLGALEEAPASSGADARAGAEKEPKSPPPIATSPAPPPVAPASAPASPVSIRQPSSGDSAPDSTPPPSRMPASRALAVLWPSVENEREEALFQELLAGSFDAGEALVASYGDASRTRDVLVVRRHQAALRPGERASLERLLAASIEDKSLVYARAVEHVLSVGTNDPAPPPPLSAQLVEPGLVQRLLFRDLASPVMEALGLVWESGLYRRDLNAYGLDKAPRLQGGTASPLASAYAAVAPLFGQRTVFQVSSDGPLRVSVALLTQPALVVEGLVKTAGTELHYLLASRLAATLPEYAIIAAEPDDSVRTLLEAIVAAFGPVGQAAPPSAASRARGAAIARIGADLWQRVQPRTERRLREIAEGGPLLLEEARERTQTAMRRAGLFAAGDLGVALRITLEELGEEGALLDEPGGLEAACRFPEVADLVRLATRMEYAEARFFATPSAATAPRSARVTSRT